jgi:HK97 gp10 family phage protein
MAVTVKFEGGRELEAALRELPKATGRNAIRRGLKKVAEPIREDAEQRAPELTGRLKLSIVTGTQLTRAQKRMAKREGTYFAEIHVGTASGHGVPQEFGTVNHPAQPFMRPAWEGGKDNALKDMGKFLWEEIEKTATRRARKLAKG